MANPNRGEVELLTGTDDKPEKHVIRFTLNSICELEEHLGEPVMSIASRMEKPEQMRMTTMRALVWAGLLHNNPAVTLQEAGDIASEAGVGKCMAAIVKAFELAFPKPEGKASRPQKAVTG